VTYEIYWSSQCADGLRFDVVWSFILANNNDNE